MRDGFKDLAIVAGGIAVAAAFSRPDMSPAEVASRKMEPKWITTRVACPTSGSCRTEEVSGYDAHYLSVDAHYRDRKASGKRWTRTRHGAEIHFVEGLAPNAPRYRIVPGTVYAKRQAVSGLPSPAKTIVSHVRPSTAYESLVARVAR